MSSTTPGSDPERPHDDADEREPAATEPDSASHDEPDAVHEEPERSAASDAAPDAAERRPPVEPEPAPAPEPVSAQPEEPEAPAAPLEPGLSSAGPAGPAGPAAAAPAQPVETVEPVESSDATARLDAAVERAKATPVASDTDDAARTGDTGITGEPRPEPVAADSAPRDTYVPAATVAAGTAAGAATLGPEPTPYIAPQAVPQTIYVQAPAAPKPRGNRGFGVLVALIGTVLFALLYAGVAYLLLLSRGVPAAATAVFTQFVVSPVFWVPVVAFFIGFALLAVIVNRGAWWYYAVFGLLVAALVYFSYLGGSLLTVEAWTLSVDETADFINQRWLDPFAIVAFIVAREIPVWLGGWIAAHGRTVAERNRLADEAYERELAAGPQPIRAD
ncbi:hypothetical protein ACFWN7_09860 [Agromyces sp. NPDC058484]|uniref:hypothetical protein n=1 Tax=Agromyces sp. NPDC058484 TaxID=3346524 RepID=UPI00365D5AAE